MKPTREELAEEEDEFMQALFHISIPDGPGGLLIEPDPDNPDGAKVYRVLPELPDKSGSTDNAR